MPHASPGELVDLLDEIANGDEPGSARLALLSDLTREEAEVIREKWQTIPAASRESLIEETMGLAELDVALDFEELAKIGLDDPERAVRLSAIAALWEATDRNAAGRLTRILKADPEESVREAAAGALREFVMLRELDQFDVETGDSVVEALKGAFQDSAEAINVRAACIEALGPRALPWINTLITDAYYHDDRVLRIAAVRAMADSANPAWLEYLEEDLQSSDPELRFEAVVAVGEVGVADSVGLVAPLIEDEDRQVAFAAIRALGAIGGDAAIEILEDVISEAEDPELREEAKAAIDIARFGEEGDEISWDE